MNCKSITFSYMRQAYFYSILAAVILASCTTTRKAARHFDEHPDKAAEYCATRFPARDTIIKGDTVTVTDVIFTNPDTVLVECTPDTVVRYKAAVCPPGRIERVTVHVTDTIVRVDMAQLRASQAREDKLREELDAVAAERDSLAEFKRSMRGKVHIPWWVIVLIGIGLAGWAYWRIKAGALNKVINKLK